MVREGSSLEARFKDRATEIEGQKVLREELARQNCAALEERRALAKDIDDLKNCKKAISFDLEPALNEVVSELERYKACAEYELRAERDKVGRLERALRRAAGRTTEPPREAEHEGPIDADLENVEALTNLKDSLTSLTDVRDVLEALERERRASQSRAASLMEGTKRWRASRAPRRCHRRLIPAVY